MTTTALPRLARPGGGAKLRARGRPQDAAWVRPVLLGIMAVAAFLYMDRLTASGYSNTYYAAAVKSASVDLKAWFFGSLDPGSFITVDKPPLSLWLMGLSARIFGFSSFSLLLPQALCTLLTVGVLHATVRRVFGTTAGLLAAGALALSPITLALARVDMPDALLVLLLVLAGWLTVRAIESGRTKHLAWAGAVVGLAFMTKMLQGWMIVPALAAAYLLAGPPRLAVRLCQLAIAGAAMVGVSAAWPLAVTLWPGETPYIGGSEDGSIWNLILGYNGFGRITGDGGGMGANFGGEPGLLRLFNQQVGGQIAWLLPLALVSLAAGPWLTRAAARTDARRAGWVLFGVWALVHAAVFSTQRGVFHPYYVSALAPAVAALVGGGVVALIGWAKRSWAGVAALDVGVLASAWTAVLLLARTPDFAPWLTDAIVVAGAAVVLGSVALRLPRSFPRRLGAVAAVAAVLAVGAGPASYTLATAGQGLSGGNVTAGPAGAQPMPGGPGGPGGDAGSADPALIAYLQAHQGGAKYLVAAIGSQATASIIVATGEPVVTIGGFNGADPAPTAAELARMVRDGELKYVLLGGGGGMGGPGGGGMGGPGGGDSSAISEWVQAHGTAVSGAGTSAGGTLYAVSA
ncbi:MAG TPA: glycosyltransferase family 39 protein [Solirubrobacteraceae bacterium]|jgi:4-amino-4-deoxy-L-arabinose transferase-like glycosyltransferase